MNENWTLIVRNQYCFLKKQRWFGRDTLPNWKCQTRRASTLENFVNNKVFLPWNYGPASKFRKGEGVSRKRERALDEMRAISSFLLLPLLKVIIKQG